MAVSTKSFRGWARLQQWIPARCARTRFVQWREGMHRSKRWRPQRSEAELEAERRKMRAVAAVVPTLDCLAAAMAISPRVVAVLTLWFGKQYWAPNAMQFEARWRYERIWTQIWFPTATVRRRVDAGFKVFLTRDFGALAKGEYAGWIATPLGALALMMLYGPLHRAMHRGHPEELTAGPKLLAVCKNALTRGFDRQLRPIARAWIYMVLLDSEKPGDCARGAKLLARLVKSCANDGTKVWARFTAYAEQQLRTVSEFGRFPQRNIDLLRRGTKAERLFVAANVPLRRDQWDLTHANAPRKPVFLDSRARYYANRSSAPKEEVAPAPKANIGRRASPWETIASFDLEPLPAPSPPRDPFRHEPFAWHNVAGSSQKEMRRVAKIVKRLPPINSAAAGQQLVLRP